MTIKLVRNKMYGLDLHGLKDLSNIYSSNGNIIMLPIPIILKNQNCLLNQSKVYKGKVLESKIQNNTIV